MLTIKKTIKMFRASPDAYKSGYTTKGKISSWRFRYNGTDYQLMEFHDVSLVLKERHTGRVLEYRRYKKSSDV